MKKNKFKINDIVKIKKGFEFYILKLSEIEHNNLKLDTNKFNKQYNKFVVISEHEYENLQPGQQYNYGHLYGGVNVCLKSIYKIDRFDKFKNNAEQYCITEIQEKFVEYYKPPIGIIINFKFLND